MWIILCAVFVIAEIFTASFFAGPIGLGCLVAAILAKVGIEGAGQLLSFSVTSVVLLLAIRPIWKRMMENRTNKEVSGGEAYVGKQGRITEIVDAQAGTGRIQIGGENWVAISDKNITLEEGTQATVVRIEGAKAIVSVSENP
jgi:membrane protein implicated in regulation of membrane protease activity